MEPIMGFRGDYNWLSNFYNAEVTVSNITYMNTESAYQAGKTLCLSTRREFQGLTGAQAKKKGKDITLRDDWHIAKFEVMELCIRAKFMSHQYLAHKLLATGNREIIEFNFWNDTIWGQVMRDDKLVGRNALGQILMIVRKDLGCLL